MPGKSNAKTFDFKQDDNSEIIEKICFEETKDEQTHKEQLPYVHQRDKSEKSVKNTRAMGKVRTDS